MKFKMYILPPFTGLFINLISRSWSTWRVFSLPFFRWVITGKYPVWCNTFALLLSLLIRHILLTFTLTIDKYLSFSSLAFRSSFRFPCDNSGTLGFRALIVRHTFCHRSFLTLFDRFHVFFMHFTATTSSVIIVRKCKQDKYKICSLFCCINAKLQSLNYLQRSRTRSPATRYFSRCMRSFPAFTSEIIVMLCHLWLRQRTV